MSPLLLQWIRPPRADAPPPGPLQTGALAALLQADYLGQMRTGAASGVATEYMARPDASEVGVFGAGNAVNFPSPLLTTEAGAKAGIAFERDALEQRGTKGPARVGVPTTITR